MERCFDQRAEGLAVLKARVHLDSSSSHHCDFSKWVISTGLSVTRESCAQDPMASELTADMVVE